MHPATATPRLQVVFQPSPRGIASTALANSLSPLLELTLAQAHVEGIYVYRFLREEASLHLAVWSGLEPTGIVHYQVQVRVKPPRGTANWRPRPFSTAPLGATGGFRTCRNSSTIGSRVWLPFRCWMAANWLGLPTAAAARPAHSRPSKVHS